MDTLFGLPAHALLIHAPIVLLPIAAGVTVALAIKRTWRRRLGWWFPAGVFSIVVMVFLARSSGQAFDEALDGAVDVTRHAELADRTFVLTIVWFVGAVALVALDRRARGSNDRGFAPPTVVASVTAFFAVLATVWLVRTGHEGADLVWRQTTERIFD